MRLIFSGILFAAGLTLILLGRLDSLGPEIAIPGVGLLALALVVLVVRRTRRVGVGDAAAAGSPAIWVASDGGAGGCSDGGGGSC